MPSAGSGPACACANSTATASVASCRSAHTSPTSPACRRGCWWRSMADSMRVRPATCGATSSCRRQASTCSASGTTRCWRSRGRYARRSWRGLRPGPHPNPPPPAGEVAEALRRSPPPGDTCRHRDAEAGTPMPDTLRIAMAQFDFPVGDVAGNTARISAMIAEARDEYGADIVLFPELAISGYPPEDLLMRPSFLARCQQALEQVAAGVHGITAVVGWPESAGSVLYNAASVLRAGRIESTYRKRELPNYAVFDERRYFEVDPDGGPCVFEVEGVPVGVVVCEDLWFPEPIADAVKAGAQLVLVPNASPFERGKHAQRDALLAERTRETGAAVAYLNGVGGQVSLVFDGASVVADGNGTVHPAAAAFTDQWLVVDYDTAGRSFTPVQWMDDGDESMDALAWRAVVRGIRDYCGKNG